jgi:hypothetical protein
MPLPTDAEAQNLFAAIGKIAVAWAFVEHGLEQCVAIAYRRCGGNKLSNQVPRALSKKIDFMRKAFRRLAALAKFQPEGLALLGRIQQSSEDRHAVIHGALSGIVEGENAFIFARIDAEPQFHKVIRSPFSVESLEEKGDSMMALALDVAQFARDMVRDVTGK